MMFEVADTWTESVDKNEYIETECSRIDVYTAQHRSKDAFNLIKELTGSFRPKLSTIKDEKILSLEYTI